NQISIDAGRRAPEGRCKCTDAISFCTGEGCAGIGSDDIVGDRQVRHERSQQRCGVAFVNAPGRSAAASHGKVPAGKAGGVHHFGGGQAKGVGAAAAVILARGLPVPITGADGAAGGSADQAADGSTGVGAADCTGGIALADRTTVLDANQATGSHGTTAVLARGVAVADGGVAGPYQATGIVDITTDVAGGVAIADAAVVNATPYKAASGAVATNDLAGGVTIIDAAGAVITPQESAGVPVVTSHLA